MLHLLTFISHEWYRQRCGKQAISGHFKPHRSVLLILNVRTHTMRLILLTFLHWSDKLVKCLLTGNICLILDIITKSIGDDLLCLSFFPFSLIVSFHFCWHETTSLLLCRERVSGGIVGDSSGCSGLLRFIMESVWDWMLHILLSPVPVKSTTTTPHYVIIWSCKWLPKSTKVWKFHHEIPYIIMI